MLKLLDVPYTNVHKKTRQLLKSNVHFPHEIGTILRAIYNDENAYPYWNALILYHEYLHNYLV